MSGVLDTLTAATPSRCTDTTCVDGALQAQWDNLLGQLEEAALEDKRTSLSDLPATTRVVEDMDAIRDRVKASEVTFVFERMEWTARVALQAEHPPRQKNMVDAIRGYNVATFLPALIKGSCVEVSNADGDTATEIPDETWDRLIGRPATGLVSLAPRRQ